jgi:hypothetical protein
VNPVACSVTPLIPVQTTQSFQSVSDVLDVNPESVVNSEDGDSYIRKTRSGRVIRYRDVLDL